MSENRQLTLSGNALLDLMLAVLKRGSSVRIRAEGFSMFPFIRNGDVVVLSALNGRSPRLGDVVAFQSSRGAGLSFHRVAGKTGNRYLIRGDSCVEADGAIPEGSIVGRVSRVERNEVPVSLGLGPERGLVAFLSRLNLLRPVIDLAGKLH